VRDKLDALRAKGFHLSDAHYQRILREIGEFVDAKLLSEYPVRKRGPRAVSSNATILGCVAFSPARHPAQEGPRYCFFAAGGVAVFVTGAGASGKGFAGAGAAGLRAPVEPAG